MSKLNKINFNIISNKVKKHLSENKKLQEFLIIFNKKLNTKTKLKNNFFMT